MPIHVNCVIPNPSAGSHTISILENSTSSSLAHYGGRLYTLSVTMTDVIIDNVASHADAAQHNLWNAINYTKNSTLSVNCAGCATYSQVQSNQHNGWNSRNYTQNQTRLGLNGVQHNLWNSDNYSLNFTNGNKRLQTMQLTDNLVPSTPITLGIALVMLLWFFAFLWAAQNQFYLPALFAFIAIIVPLVQPAQGHTLPAIFTETALLFLFLLFLFLHVFVAWMQDWMLRAKAALAAARRRRAGRARS
jgi:hypothetical protein